MKLNENIKQRRSELQLTLEEVAKVVGVSRQTIQRYESGVIGSIPSDKIEKLAVALQTTPGYLMSGVLNSVPPEHEINIDEAIKKAYGETTKDAVRLFTQLDLLDQGQTIGTMKLLLDAPKYKKEKSGA